MERLTELKYDITKLDSRIKNMHEYIEKMAFDDKAEVEILASTVSYLKELREYKQLEEQGLLLRLPTEAYFIKNNIVRKGWVQELVYSPCRKLLLDIRYDDNSLDSYRGYVGNTVFLTQAEAEQKLKEMESK